MLFKLSNLNSNLTLTLGYLNPALNNSAQEIRIPARFGFLEMALVNDRASNKTYRKRC